MPEEKKAGEMKRVTVEIFGDVYHLKTDDPEGLEKIVYEICFAEYAHICREPNCGYGGVENR